MIKTYFVESELCDRVGFQNESDRNELALALYEEHIYFLTMRLINWYHERGVIKEGIEEDSSSNVFTWEEYESFDVPTQVAFWEEGMYHAGIAYGEEIICACCGGVQEIKEIYAFAPSGVEPIVVYKNWVNFNESIIGDEEADFELEEE